jgi:hypothetical protein
MNDLGCKFQAINISKIVSLAPCSAIEQGHFRKENPDIPSTWTLSQALHKQP